MAYIPLIIALVMLLVLLVAPLLLYANPKHTEEFEQWLRYVAKAAPMVLATIPNMPPALIPIITEAIQLAEITYGTDEGVAKKALVLQTAAQSEPGLSLPELPVAIDNIIKMGNLASTVSTNLNKGLNADGSEKG